jgi:hypothetical protein
MMTGHGPHGPLEMGGMFTVMKVRDDVKPGDYRDPGWYKAPPGTVAREWTADLAEAPRAAPRPDPDTGSKAIEMTLRKPEGHGGHH